MTNFSSKYAKSDWAVRLCFGFFGVVLLLLPTDAAEKKLAPEQLPLLERQRWALSMLDRLDRANRVILDPKYVDHQHKHFDKLAQPFVLGTSPQEAGKTVQAIRAEVDKSERIAIEHLDRQFRRTLSQKFSTKSESGLRDRWFSTWKTTVQTWQKSGDPTDQLDKLLVWLQQSRTTLEGKQYTTVTPIPSFSGETVKVTEKVVTPANKTEKKTVPPKVPSGQDIDHTAAAPVSPPTHVVQRPVTPPVTFSATKPQVQLEKPRVQTEKPSKMPLEKPSLDINLPELAAQVSGNNLAIRRLEAKLVGVGTWDAKRMDPLVVKLKQIATRLGDAQMVYRLLSTSQQKQIDKIADPAAAIKSLRSKIGTARVAVLESRGPSASLTKGQRVELKRLDELGEELDSFDGGVDE